MSKQQEKVIITLKVWLLSSVCINELSSKIYLPLKCVKHTHPPSLSASSELRPPAILASARLPADLFLRVGVVLL